MEINVLAKAFAHLDTDENGELGVGEFSPNNFFRIDRDKNGFINQADFAALTPADAVDSVPYKKAFSGVEKSLQQLEQATKSRNVLYKLGRFGKKHSMGAMGLTVGVPLVGWAASTVGYLISGSGAWLTASAVCAAFAGLGLALLFVLLCIAMWSPNLKRAQTEEKLQAELRARCENLFRAVKPAAKLPLPAPHIKTGVGTTPSASAASLLRRD